MRHGHPRAATKGHEALEKERILWLRNERASLRVPSLAYPFCTQQCLAIGRV